MKRGHCHPEPAQRDEGPPDCNRRALLARNRELQLRDPAPSAWLRMTGFSFKLVNFR